MKTAANNGYIPSLDGLRAASIALVFVSHVGFAGIPGGFGVTVFFFLSGFLITTLLVKEQEEHGWIALKAFYLRRVVRLAPPLLVTLAFSILLVLIGFAEGDLAPNGILSQLLFFYNYYLLYFSSGGSVDGLGILWSLSVEEHFYILYPAVFIALTRGWIGLRTIAVMLIVVLLWRYVQHYGFGNREWVIYLRTDTRIDSMLYGCFLALLTWRGHTEKWLPDRWMLLFLVAALGALLFTFLFRDPAFRSTLRYTIQGIALIPIFHFAVTRPEMPFFQPLNWKPIRRVGQYSYTLYLIHFVIIKAMIFNGIDQENRLIFVPVAIGLSLLYAALVFEFVEKPFKPLRQRLTGH